MKMQLNCGCCALTYGQYPSLVDVQILEPEIGTEEVTNWYREQWPRRDFWTVFKWVGTLPTSGPATPVRYTYNLDMTQDWNPVNARWVYGGMADTSWGSFPPEVEARPRHITGTSLCTGAFYSLQLEPGGQFYRHSVPTMPVEKFRVWVDGVDVTGIKEHTSEPAGIIDLGLSFSKAEPYRQVFIDVDVWFAPMPGNTGVIEVVWGSAVDWDPQIRFSYEFRNPVITPVIIEDSLTGSVWTNYNLSTISPSFGVHGGQWTTPGAELMPFASEIPANYRYKIDYFDPMPSGSLPTVGIWNDLDTPTVLNASVASARFPHLLSNTHSDRTMTVTKA